MENEIQNQITEYKSFKQQKRSYSLPASILISAVILASAWIYTNELKVSESQQGASVASDFQTKQKSALGEKVLPSAEVILPVVWGDLGARLISVGAIDADKFKAIYEQRGLFTDEYKNLLLGQNDGQLKITENNAGYLLNLFWALGLANKNPILDDGEMTNRAYGGAQNFASTAGWTVAQGNPMDHYSNHKFFDLTAGQQALVDKISRGIYRPCCDNPTHFPDCNHGMAMLGLLELMASQGVGEQDMWRAALAANSYWFPDTYLTIALYMSSNGVGWDNANPQEILGANFSSASGYARIASQVQSQPQRGGSGCGVDAGRTTQPQRQQGGCGI